MEKIKKWILAISIIVVLNLFFNYGIWTFYKPDKFEDYCKDELRARQYSSREECEAVGGLWNENIYPLKEIAPATTVPTQPVGYCEAHYSCSQKFDSVMALYNRNVFIILLAAGVLSLVGGFYFSLSEAVSLGLSFGGVLSMIIGSIRYWSDMNDYLRFVILGIALAILIGIGVKKFRNAE